MTRAYGLYADVELLQIRIIEMLLYYFMGQSRAGCVRDARRALMNLQDRRNTSQTPIRNAPELAW